MTTSQIPFRPGAFTTPVVDYEPPAFDVTLGPPPQIDAADRVCSTPLPAALHRSPRRTPLPAREPAPPPAAAGFADAALRRVLEVIDRRRPLAALRPMLTPRLMDMIFTTLTRSAAPDKAGVLRRVRLRTAGPGAAEVFATYSRGQRVRAIAGRIEVDDGRWRLVALQVG